MPLSFHFNLFTVCALFWEPLDFTEHHVWLARALGAQEFQNPLPILSVVSLSLLVTIGVLAGWHTVQLGSEVSERPAIPLLKPQQDYVH